MTLYTVRPIPSALLAPYRSRAAALSARAAERRAQREARPLVLSLA